MRHYTRLCTSAKIMEILYKNGLSTGMDGYRKFSPTRIPSLDHPALVNSYTSLAILANIRIKFSFEFGFVFHIVS
jgi:hypothetical protein